MAYSSTTEAIATAQRILDTVQSEAEVAKALSEGHPLLKHLNTFQRQNIQRTQAATHVWRKIGRQVLAMHPEIVEEVRVAHSDQIPGEVLRTLPYMNPLVVFAEPPVFKSWLQGGVHRSSVNGKAEDSMRLLGFFTYGTAEVQVNEPILHNDEVKAGVRVEQRIYSTTATEANRFGLMLVLEVLDATGKAIDVEFNSMTLFFDRTASLAETVDDLMARYHWDSSKNGGDMTQARKWMREVLGVVIGSLFYLCSTTLEAEKVPAKATRNLGRNISRKPLSLYRVGWTTGAALTRLRQQRIAESTSQQGDLTHQQDPQHRRGHFKMQPYGPQRALRRLIYVSPYWTKVEQLGQAGMNTARAVPRVGDKGDARQSLKTAMGLRVGQ